MAVRNKTQETSEYNQTTEDLAFKVILEMARAYRAVLISRTQETDRPDNLNNYDFKQLMRLDAAVMLFETKGY